MAAVDDALAGVFERLPVFDQVPGAFEIGGEYYVAASVVGDGKVAISLTIGEGPKRVEPLHEDLFDDAEHFFVSAMEQLSLRQPIERLADVINKTSA